MEDSVNDYASSLHDLTTNSKPLITMLTMLADDNRQYAESIVAVIEDYLKRSCAKIKLPTLYLIDSIIKNVGEPYKKLFIENIIKIFLDVFQEGDEKTRSALYKLRQTWKGLLPDGKLYMIDALTKGIDPNWPICPTLEHLANNIHLNPKFFGRQPPIIEIHETETSHKDKVTTVKEAVASAEQKMVDVSKQRHPRAAPDGQTISLDRESGENLRITELSANRSDQRRTDPRLKRRQQQPMQLFEQQLLQPDVVMAEKAKNSDLFSGKESLSGTASSSGKGSDKKSSIKRTRSSEKEQQRVNGKRQTSDSHSGSSKERTTSSKSNKDKTSSFSPEDRKSSRSAAGGGNCKKSSKSSSSSSTSSSSSSRVATKTVASQLQAPSNKSPTKSAGETPTGLRGGPSLADKEAAAILTGDVDLRILEPHAKKPKTETTVVPEPVAPLELFPKGDIDLRIRPTGGVSDPGQPLVSSSTATDRNVGEQQGSTHQGIIKNNVDEDEEEEFDKEAQWAKLKGRPVRNPTMATIQERGTRKDTTSEDRGNVATSSTNSHATVPAVSELVRAGATESGVAASGLRPPAHMPGSQGARIPMTVLPIVDVTPKQNAIPDLFPPGRSRAHIKISDPAPDSGQIRLDGRMREVRFVDGVAIAVMDEAPPNFVRARQIMFKGGSSKKILINEHHQIMAAFDGREHEFTLNNNRHRIRFGAPLRELYVDGIPYSCQFNGVPVYIRSREDVFSVTLHPPCPSVNDKMEAPKELLAKLGLLPMPPDSLTLGPGGCVVGMLPPGGQVPIAPIGAPMGSAPAHLMGGPSTGGWVRYQDDRMSPAPHLGPPGPPGPHPPPGMYPPPGMPHGMGPLPPPGSFGPGHPGPPGMFGPPPPSAMGGPMPGPPMGPGPYGPMGPPGMMPYGQQPHPGMHGHPHMIGPAGGILRPPIGPPMGPPRPQERRMPAPPSVVAPVTAPVSLTPVASVTPAVQPVNVSDLLSQLVNYGIIGGSSTTSTTESVQGSTDSSEKKPTGSILNPTIIKEEIPKLSFKQTDQLKQRYGGVISALHDGLQCATCGQRFKQVDKNSDKYAQHLDWHFRMARKEREGLKKASSRKWFYDITDWVQFEEVEDIEDRARSYFELQEAQHDATSQDSQAPVVQEVPSVPAKVIDHGDNTCVLCREPFTNFFCEENEEWRLKNAILYEGQLFHPGCHEDYLKPARKPSPEVKEEPEDDQSEVNKDVISESEKKMDIEEQRLEGIDDGSQPLPGLDFAPTSEELPSNKVKTDTAEQTVSEEAVKSEPKGETEKSTENEEPMEEDLNDTVRAAEQSVVVEELGEFGVDNLPPSVEHGYDLKDEEKSQDSSVGVEGLSEEAKKQQHESCEHQEQADTIAKQDSPQNQFDESADHSTTSKLKVFKGSGGFILKVKQETMTNGGDARGGVSQEKSSQDSGVGLEEHEDYGQNDDDEEWVPPQPDPAFKNLPMVKRGAEESGLCSIM